MLVAETTMRVQWGGGVLGWPIGAPVGALKMGRGWLQGPMHWNLFPGVPGP